jgi:hypothetical protein
MSGPNAAPLLEEEDPKLAIERAYLGALMNASTLTPQDLEAKPDDFADKRNGVVFTAIAELKRRSEGIGLLTVKGELRRLGRLNGIGGEGYLSDLTDTASEGREPAFYLSSLHTAAKRRSLGKDLEGAAEDLRSGASPGDVVSNITIALAGLEEWPERQPLPPVSSPVPELPPDLIPSPLRSWLCDVSERVSVPLEFVAAPAVVALGAVIGRAMAIRPMHRDDWTVPANLWGGIIGRPGVMKTAAVSEALRPIRRLEALAREEFEREEANREAEREAIDARRKATRAGLEKATKGKDTAGLSTAKDELKALRAEEQSLDAKERRFSTSDATIEKAGELLNENPRGLLIVRDELTGFLRGLDRDDRAQDRTFYLESWNGSGAFTVDRIGRGTLHVPALTLSIVGGIQPGRLAPYVSGAIEGAEDADGLMQRFQVLVWPDTFGEWRDVDRWPMKDARERAFSIFQRLADAAPEDFGAQDEEDEIPFLRFAADAQGLFLEWRYALETRLRSDDLQRTPAFESHLSKYRSLFPKLALLFHLVDVADGAPAGPVPLRAAQMAAAWTEFLEAHARKVYAEELAGDVGTAHLLAAKIKEGAIVDGMDVRSIIRREWAGLRGSGKVHAGVEELARLGWLRIGETEPGDRGGRPSTFLRLRPDLKGKV